MIELPRACITANEIAKHAEERLKQNDFKKGYRDGVIIIEIT